MALRAAGQLRPWDGDVYSLVRASDGRVETLCGEEAHGEGYAAAKGDRVTRLDLFHTAVWITAVLAVAVLLGGVWSITDRMVSRYLGRILDDGPDDPDRRAQLNAATGRRPE